MNLPIKYPIFPNNSFFHDDISNIQKEVDDIELNFKSNYYFMLSDVTKFKPLIEYYLNLIMNCNHKIDFIYNTNANIKNDNSKILELKNKLYILKNQFIMFSKMYELRTLTVTKKL